jgi:hypothetical protein
MPVTLEEAILASERPGAIRRFLAPLAPDAGVACNSPKSLIDGGRVWAAHDGQIAGKEYRDWRFGTRYADIRCSYFELWKPSGSGRTWFLDRAYLTLFLTDRTTRQSRELLGVHSDPECEDPQPMRDFKKGPHLHVKHLVEPLPHSHFPLTIGYADHAIRSSVEMTRLLSEIANLLSVEVLNRFIQGSPDRQRR